MRVLIFGGNGMLGHKLVQVLSKQLDVWYTLRGNFAEVERYGIFERDRCVEGVDVENAVAVRSALVEIKPDVVINAVGIVKQLASSKDTIKTLSVNSIFPHRLNELAAEIGFRIVCISTDCVFDGFTGNYSEVDEPNATDLYGKSKNLGELTSGNSLTLRTSIIGRELGTGHSLVEWFLSNEGKSVKGFANAIYSGFPTFVLADIIRNLICEYPTLRGLYHVASDAINKYDLLQLLNAAYDAKVEIEHDEDFRIDRSLNSAKFRELTGFVPARWNEMIMQMAADPTPYGIWKQGKS